MKKCLITVFLSVFLAAGPVFASEELEIFTYLYDAAQSPTDQLGILESVMEMKISGAGSLYARAMARLVRDYPSIRSATEKQNAEFLATLLAEALGNEKQVASAGDLWRAVTSFSNPLVKSESMMALGKMRATPFLPQIVQLLSDLNNRPMTADPLGGERIAFGAIISLEKFQDPSGYLPVFFASNAWYSDRVKSQAVNSLPLIMEDPTEPMLLVVRGAGYTPAVKLVALKNMESSKVSNQSKSTVALAALTTGWSLNPADTRQRTDLVTLRKDALGMLSRYGSNDSAVYEQLLNSYGKGDYQEKIAAIQVLTFLKTPEAAQNLNNMLNNLNQKQRAGTATQEDNNLVRAIIPALGTIADRSSRPFLTAVSSSNWAAAVETLARDALGKIK